jgi:hypothetical protein
MKNLTNTLTFAYNRYDAMQLFAIALLTVALLLVIAVILIKIGIRAIKENIRAAEYRRDFEKPRNTFKKDPELENLSDASKSFALVFAIGVILLVVANNL